MSISELIRSEPGVRASDRDDETAASPIHGRPLEKHREQKGIPCRKPRVLVLFPRDRWDGGNGMGLLVDEETAGTVVDFEAERYRLTRAVPSTICPACGALDFLPQIGCRQCNCSIRAETIEPSSGTTIPATNPRRFRLRVALMAMLAIATGVAFL